ncbi:MAG: hypothetical protein Q8S73_30520 [Deltaproteobacteria bacterium]|nr:hypothetical protein [Myxococcales bacterium]MDP3218479.1 hypothetical protein [Deltaproteobacteria bacterium]
MPPIIALPYLTLAPWVRIEPSARDRTMALGLRAEIADPTWLLGRQLQLGELNGEDAASPVFATVKVRSVALAAPPLQDLSGRPRDVGTLPDEATIEALDLRSPGSPCRVILGEELAWCLMRRLYEDEFGGVWRRLLATAEDAGLRGRRGLDGLALLTAMDRGEFDVAGWVDAGRRDELLNTLSAWRDECHAAWLSGPTGWVPGQLSHRATMTDQGGTPALEVNRHPGGPVGWYAADVVPGEVPLKTRETTIQRVPTPLRYAGMPARRWWEIEDHAVLRFDSELESLDLVRNVALEFGTVYSDDWYAVPIPFEAGQLVRLARVEVEDTFSLSLQRARGGGQATVLEVDNQGDADRWNSFRQTVLPRPDDASSSPDGWLWVPRGSADRQVGSILEEVAFLRDEGANLGWGVERIVEGKDGRPYQRAELIPGEEVPVGVTTWEYRLSPAVPPGWIPFLPIGLAHHQIALQRARLPSWGPSTGDETDDGPRSLLLRMESPMFLPEHEIPPGGVVVRRAWVRARSLNGRPVMWMRFERHAGSGLFSTDFGFDRLLLPSLGDAETR